jgi:hypothetical protein
MILPVTLISVQNSDCSSGGGDASNLRIEEILLSSGSLIVEIITGS